MNTYILYITVYAIEALILLLYTSQLFHSRVSHYVKILLLSGLYCNLYFISTLSLAWLNILAFITTNFIYIWIVYQVKYCTALFHAAITTIIMGMSELIVFSVRTLFTTNFYAEYDFLKNLIILSVFSKTLYFLISQFILRLFKTDNKTVHKTSPLLIAVPIATVFVMVTLFAATLTISSTPLVDGMISISGFLLLASNMAIFGIHNYTQRKEYELAELRLQLQKEYDATEYRKELLQENENRSILIHDIKNHLRSIAALNQSGESDRISTYIDTLINSSSLQTSIRICEHELLNVILCRYTHNCKQRNISIHTDIRSKCLDFISDDDLTALFCNLLDNALDAASGIPNGFIELSAVRKENTSFTLINMINTCSETPFDRYGNLMIRKHNKELHGFGMKSIQRITSKYNGEMSYYFDETSSTFHTIIIVSDI